MVCVANAYLSACSLSRIMQVPFLVLLVSHTRIIRVRTDPLVCRTTYVGQVMALELDREPDADFATRTGEFAMLLYSIGTVFIWILRQVLTDDLLSCCYCGHNPSASGKS